MATAKYIMLGGVAYAPNHPKVKNYVALPQSLSDKLIPKPRVRQNQKPLMNKLESEYFSMLNSRCPNYPRPRAQAKTYRLANGVRYTPDITATTWPQPNGPDRETAWEVKGNRAWDDALVKIKVAAATWPEVAWFLVWKESEEWRLQEIFP